MKLSQFGMQSLLISAGLMAGCSHTNENKWPSEETSLTEDPDSSNKSYDRTTSKLLEKASRQREEKEYLKAQMTLERAHRIAPHDASVSLALAQIHTDQRKWRTGISWAERTLESIDEDHRLYSEAWMVIYRCKSELGDLAGAAEAVQKASN